MDWKIQSYTDWYSIVFYSMDYNGNWIYCGHFFDSEAILYSVYGFAYFLQFSGFSSFTANIIQYNIDQLVGASANELTSFICYLDHLWLQFFTFLLIL
uniref:Uncharacterized protein n=1 Tax=Amphimedon queenslandica TaxID=400682 RepID=A0A1X7SHK5_AMPQE